MNIRRPTEKELWIYEKFHLTRDLPCNNNSANQQELTHDEYNALILQAENREVCSMNLKKRIHRMIGVRMSDWYKFNNYFLYPREDLTKDTIQHNKREGKINHSIPMRKHHKTRNPIIIRNRLIEGNATDNVFLEVTSFEGYNCVQGFIGIDSKYRS